MEECTQVCQDTDYELFWKPFLLPRLGPWVNSFVNVAVGYLIYDTLCEVSKHSYIITIPSARINTHALALLIIILLVPDRSHCMCFWCVCGVYLATYMFTDILFDVVLGICTCHILWYKPHSWKDIKCYVRKCECRFNDIFCIKPLMAIV